MCGFFRCFPRRPQTTEQREVRAQSATFVSSGTLDAALRGASDGFKPSNSAVSTIPTARDDLEAHAGEPRKFDGVAQASCPGEEVRSLPPHGTCCRLGINVVTQIRAGLCQDFGGFLRNLRRHASTPPKPTASFAFDRIVELSDARVRCLM